MKNKKEKKYIKNQISDAISVPERIMRIFQKYYPILKGVEISLISKQYLDGIDGYTAYNITQDFQKKGKCVTAKIKPQGIYIDEQLQGAKLIYVILHELGHCVSDHVQRTYEINKRIQIQHPRQFYDKLLQIIKIANQQKIFQKQFKSINQLMKYDKAN